MDNTPQEIIAIGTYAFRFTYSLEPLARQKALVALLNDGLLSPGYNALLDSVNSSAPGAVTRPQALAQQDSFPIGTVTSSGDLTSVDGQLPFRDVTTVNAIRWYYTESPSPFVGGAPISSWYRN